MYSTIYHFVLPHLNLAVHSTIYFEVHKDVDGGEGAETWTGGRVRTGGRKKAAGKASETSLARQPKRIIRRLKGWR